mmetsp:Transcript_3027/g.5684  ORF Transcript_3027/g.5684 Transcript_3027/m.5684 type:complete len:621 (-) Transcript_3027:14-1876(-)
MAIFAVSLECLSSFNDGYLINQDYTSPEDLSNLTWKPFLMFPNYYQHFIRTDRALPIIPMNWAYLHQDTAFLSNNNGTLYPNFDAMTPSTVLNYETVVRPLFNIFNDPSKGSENSITSCFISAFQSMNLPIVKDHFALNIHYSKPYLPDYSKKKNIVRILDRLLGLHCRQFFEDNKADVGIFSSDVDVSSIPLDDDEIPCVRVDTKSSTITYDGETHIFNASSGNRADYWTEHPHTMYVFIEQKYSGDKRFGFALGSELLLRHNGIDESNRNKGNMISLEELRNVYSVEFFSEVQAAAELQSACDTLISGNWDGLTTMKAENLDNARHAKKLKSVGLLDTYNILNSVQGVRVELAEGQSNKDNLVVYHRRGDLPEELVALITTSNTLFTEGKAGTITIASDNGDGGSTALFPSLSRKKVILASIFTAKKDGVDWQGSEGGADIREYTLTRTRTYLLGKSTPDVHPDSWGSDVTDLPGYGRFDFLGGGMGFVDGDKVLVRFDGEDYSTAMAMQVHWSFYSQWSFIELNNDGEPVELSPSYEELNSSDSGVMQVEREEEWEAGRGDGKAWPLQYVPNSGGTNRQTIICGVLERLVDYDGDPQGGLFIGASRLKRGGGGGGGA